MLTAINIPPQVLDNPPAIVAPSDPTCTERGCPVPAPVPTSLVERGSGRTAVKVNPYLNVRLMTDFDPEAGKPERLMVLLTNHRGEEKLVDLLTNRPKFSQVCSFIRCNFDQQWSMYESWTPEEDGVSEPF